MSIKLKTTSNGSVSLTPEDTASDVVLTVPAVTGELDRINRAGNVLQVVHGTTSTEVSSSSSAMVDTGLSATITPIDINNKILVFVSHPMCFKSSQDGANGLGIKLFRDATELASLPFMGYTESAIQNYFSVQLVLFDAPATTSLLTYKTQFNSAFSTVQTAVQKGNTISTITLMEIAG